MAKKNIEVQLGNDNMVCQGLKGHRRSLSQDSWHLHFETIVPFTHLNSVYSQEWEFPEWLQPVHCNIPNIQ